MTGERSAPTQESISFGPFELSSGERILRRDGLVLPLGGRALDILIYLVGRPGEVVTKKELIDHAWPNVVVEEGSLRVHIAAIRKALGDGQFGNRYITSIKGRGYCFVAPVSRLSAASRPVDDGSTSKKGPAFPPRLSRMIGREVAVDTISGQLVTGRFVTIVGAGGIGKTTVAVSIGRRLFEEFGDLVYFIDLGSLKDPLLVASAIGLALGLPINERDPVPNLIAALRHRRVLLVFDSCEHVIETASVLAKRIFNEAPQVHILATSREVLSVEGEQVHRLAPLECPSAGAHPTAEEALAFPAVRLFVERATANQARFAFSDADASWPKSVENWMGSRSRSNLLLAALVHTESGEWRRCSTNGLGYFGAVGAQRCRATEHSQPRSTGAMTCCKSLSGPFCAGCPYSQGLSRSKQPVRLREGATSTTRRSFLRWTAS